MAAKKKKSAAAPRRDGAVAARYTGAGHGKVRCEVGNCDWEGTASNHATARGLVSRHWEEAH